MRLRYAAKSARFLVRKRALTCALGGPRTPNLLIRSQMLYPLSYERRPCSTTEEELRLIEANRRTDEKTRDVIRRALRLLDREAWEERARADMHRLKTEDLSAEADAWEYGADGSIRIVGTSLTVQARPTE